MIQSAPFNVVDYGAVGDGTTNDTAAFNAAMLAAANAGGGVVLAMPAKTHYIATTILIPANVILDLQEATLKGTGNSVSANILVQSAVLTSGSLVANTSANALTHVGVRNGNFFNAKQAMSLQSCIDACAFENLTINACYNGIYANFCLYATFSNIMFRNTTVGYGYTFTNNCNAITLKNVYAAGTNPGTIGTGFIFSAKTYSVNMLNCSAEFCSTGILTEELNNFTIDGCYFESVALAINMQNIYRKTGVEIKNCFFSACPILINANTTDGFYWAVSNQRFNCSPGTFNVFTDPAYGGASYLGVCTGLVEYVISSVTPTSVGVPAWMTISDGLEFRGVSNASQSGSGLSTPIYAKSFIRSGANNGIVPFEYGGGTSAVTGTVPFCVVSIPTGASVTATMQTGITGTGQSMIIFWISLVDTSGTYVFQGRAYGTTVYMDSAIPAGYTCTVTSGGYLLLNIGAVKNASGVATVTGQIRHI